MAKKLTDINLIRMAWLMLTEYSILGVLWDYLTLKPEMADKHTKNRRRGTCEWCDDKIKATNQCSICGCWIKAKTMYKKSKCPRGKW